MSHEQHDRGSRDDGAVLNSERLADRAAIEDLAIAYAHAVDDRDWRRWERLFWPDATIDYRSAGGIPEHHRPGVWGELSTLQGDRKSAF